ncbi:hypothetical protein DH2020_032126 [Rehmannia glutinosa]|uniref:Uncharacterized protein n=1 Tax=Rehmannia glutinosa TaxID=99300 RepID=A0ABR0VIY3_REHGL
MAMGAERSKTIHNFTMPLELRWGNQKYPRRTEVNSDGRISLLRRSTTVDSHSSDHHRYDDSGQQRRTVRDRGSHKVGTTPPPASDGGRRFGDDGDGIAAVREKVMLDLQTAADKMKHAIFKDGLEEGEICGSPPPPPAAAPVEGEIDRPWNLRTRRAACKTPVSRFISSTNCGVAAAAADAMKPNSGFSDMRTASTSGGAGAAARTSAAARSDKRGRPKFSVALSKREIEEDFLAMVGHRPARRPKKRAKIVQRQLDTLFPGLWLTEVTPAMYKVTQAPP